MRRLGGGYGGKITNSLPIASTCAVAAVKMNRPVRVVLDIENMIDMCSSRLPYLISYEVRRFGTGAQPLDRKTDNAKTPSRFQHAIKRDLCICVSETGPGLQNRSF